MRLVEFFVVMGVLVLLLGCTTAPTEKTVDSGVKTVRIGESVTAGPYVVKLSSITTPTEKYPNGQAVVEISKNNVVMVTDTIPANSSKQFTIDEDRVTVYVYRQNADLNPANRWSEIRVVAVYR